MFINPKEVIEKGYLTAASISSIDAEQIQQVGVDLRVAGVNQISGMLTVGIKEKSLPAHHPLELEGDGWWHLNAGVYTIDTMEYVRVPVDCAAFVLHRSTFNSSGIAITGSIYDAGFQGVVGVTMYVFTPLALQITARIAQMVFIRGESASLYDGSYQHKRSHEERSK